MAKETKKAATDKKVAANKTQEAAAKKAEEEAAAKAAEEAAAKKAEEEAKALEAAQAKPSYFEHKGAQYRFKKTAPKTLNIDGVPRSTKHLLEDKEVMLELISGNNSFVERIK